MDRSKAQERDLTPLIGRNADLKDLTGLVANPDVRLVTVTGAGGIGKTRLARTVMRDVAPDFTDGVHFVDLVAVARPELMPEAIAAALKLTMAESTPTGDALIAELETHEALLILDNMEHLLPAVPYI